MNGVPRLHLVTDDRVLADPAFLQAARDVLTVSGPDVALHLRGPGTTGRTLFRLAADLVPRARSAGAWLVVNDRVDVAASVGASAVQLAGRSLPVAEVRALQRRGLLAPELAVGASVHDPDEAGGATAADWLVVGTLFGTPSHPGRPGAGPGLVTRVGRATALPLVGIGGISPDRVAAVLAAGAHGVAILRGVWAPPGGSPARAVKGYLQAIDDARQAPT